MKDLCTEPKTEQFSNDIALRSWLEDQAKLYQLQYLLAHADDGVIWGRFDESDRLITADQVFNTSDYKQLRYKPNLPSLRVCSLHQCRVFGKRGEVLVWKSGDTWQSRFCQNFQDTKRIIRENQILWGTEGIEKDDFTLLSDGQEGLHHAVPLQDISFSKKSDKGKAQHRPVRLTVHHYIDYDDDGVAYIGLSRLVNLIISKES